MNVELAVVDIATFAFEVAERADPNAWLGLVVPVGRQQEIVERLIGAITAVSDFQVYTLRAPIIRDLARELANKPEQIVLLWDLQGLSLADWKHFDQERSRLSHRAPVLLVLTHNSAESLIRHAPNLASWMGSISRVEPEAREASSDDVQRRLDALVAHYGFSSSALLDKAKKHELPADPDIAEWLVLLGRGDLLEC